MIVKGSSAPQWPSLIVARNGMAEIDRLAFDITLHHGGATVAASTLNGVQLPRDGIAVFTPRWGHASRSYLNPHQAVREYIVNAHHIVITVNASITATAVPAGGMVIVAQGAGSTRLGNAGIGRSARVGLSAKVRTKVPGGVYSAIGVGQVLISHGIDSRLGCISDPAVARTVVGIKPGGQELFVVTIQGQTDSAAANFSGASIREAQGILRSLGAYDAATFDGGGSTILTARFGNAYKMVSMSPGWTRPVPNSFAFWTR